MKKYKEDKNEPFVGSGNLRAEAKLIKELEKKIRDLEEENAILKKRQPSLHRTKSIKIWVHIQSPKRIQNSEDGRNSEINSCRLLFVAETIQ